MTFTSTPICQVQEGEVLSALPYLLFYQRVDCTADVDVGKDDDDPDADVDV